MADEKTLRLEIRKKLKEYGADTDGLAEYIAVMMSNKRDKKHVLEDLDLFLTPNTKIFVEWLFTFTGMQKKSEEEPSRQKHEIKTEKSLSNISHKSSKKSSTSPSDKFSQLEKPSKTDQPGRNSEISKKTNEKEKKSKRSSSEFETQNDAKRKIRDSQPLVSDYKRRNVMKSIFQAIEETSSHPENSSSDALKNRKDSTKAHSSVHSSSDSSSLESASRSNRHGLRESLLPQLAETELDTGLISHTGDLREVLNRRRKVSSAVSSKELEINSPSLSINDRISTNAKFDDVEGPVKPQNESKLKISLDDVIKMGESTSSNQQQKKTEKCKFWPSCRNMAQCVYFHPIKPCSNFPNCSFGKDCIFVHPFCKFRNNCINPKCIFTHMKSTGLTDFPSAPFVKSTECHFGVNCKNPACTFLHSARKNILTPDVKSLKWQASSTSLPHSSVTKTATAFQKSNDHVTLMEFE